MSGQEQIQQVQVRRLGPGSWELSYPQFGVAMVFRGLVDDRDSITAEIQAYSQDIWLGITRGNLLTHQWRKAFSESLQERYRACPWREVLDDACMRVLMDYRTPPEVISLARLAVGEFTDAYLCEPLLYEGVPTVLVGDGGTGKSTLALALAVCVAAGAEVLPGVRPVRSGPVLYMDWEDRAHVHAARLRKICNGLGISCPEEVYYQEMSMPLGDVVEEVQERVARTGAVLCICDSLALAAGGEPEEGKSAINYFRSVNSLRVTNLSVAHVAKADLREGEVRPYGSVFVRNSARAVWSVRQQHLGNSVILEVNQEKTNRGKYAGTFRWRMKWEKDALLITSLSDNELAQISAPTDERVMAALRSIWEVRASEGKKPEARRSEVVLLTGLPRSTVWSALERLVARGLAVQVAQTRPGDAAVYAPPTGEESEEDPGPPPF